jgi:hypothetical protein
LNKCNGVKPIFKKKPKKNGIHKNKLKFKLTLYKILILTKFNKSKKNHSEDPYIYIMLNIEKNSRTELKKLAQY